MRFRTKLVLLYAAFFFLVVSGLGIYFYQYSTRQYTQDKTNNLELMAEQVQNQFNALTEKMEYRIRFMLSDPEVLRSIVILGDPEGMRGEYLDSARNTIQNSMIIDSTMNSFYRVLYFNETGEIIAMKSRINEAIDKNVDFHSMPWLQTVDKMQGKPVLVNTHKDIWGYKNKIEVFSIVKKVLGKNTGYIEIQFDSDKLKELLKIANPNGEVIVLSNETELLFSTSGTVDPAALYSEDFLYGEARQEAYGIRVIVRENKKSVMEESSYILKMCVLIMVTVYLLLLSFICIISNYLTKPLNKLKKIIETTEIENMGQSANLEDSDDEITALSESYQNSMVRLKKAMIQERRLAVLQMEAQFNFLQAQVNPHFIYNVLNVISGKGIESGDESICIICGKLAAMLRYSADTDCKYATLSSEIQYVEQYLFLLKCRYDYKLNFTIDVEADVREQRIPKIVLQQIVENCMNHGFQNKTENMLIQICGVRKGGKIQISVRDNGQGFTEACLSELKERFSRTKEQLLHSRENITMKIGGMGLVNTYARLLLKYQADLEFYFGNSPDGAEVWFEIPFLYGEVEEEDV